MARYLLTGGDDTIVGTDERDVFEGEAGGIDGLSGGNGNDTFALGYVWGLEGHIKGGSGWDTLQGQGQFANATISGIEAVDLTSRGLVNAFTMAQLNSLKVIKSTDYFGQMLAVFVEGEGGTIDFAGRMAAGHGVSFGAWGPLTSALIVSGTREADVLIGSHLDDKLSAGAGNDGIGGFAGDDTLDGGAGDDVMEGNDGNDLVHGGGGNDSIDGHAGSDTLFGGAGDDTLMGADGDGGTGYDSDSLVGGAGNDQFQLGRVNYSTHAVQGGVGWDTLIANGAIAMISMTGIETLDLLESNLNLITLDQLQSLKVIKSSAHAGEQLSLILHGAGGTIDLSSKVAAGHGVIVWPNSSLSSALTAFGTSSSDTFGGTEFSDRLSGLGSYDGLEGHGGNDTLDGGGGNDELRGGDGDDLALGGFGDDAISGWAGNDSLYGGAGTDLIEGGDGNDLLGGAVGADSLIGGAGDDTYIVGEIGGRIVEVDGGGRDLVRSSVSINLIANIEDVKLTGTGDISAFGNNDANVMTGNAGMNYIAGNGGSDLVSGWAGNDTLDGGFGADTLIGGRGDDVFAFTTALGNGNVDVIRTFGNGQDKILLADWIFADLVDGAFHAGTTAEDAGDRIVYDQSTGRLFYDADGTGAIAQVQFAEIYNRAALTEDGSFSVWHASTSGGGEDTYSGSGSDLLLGGSGEDSYVVDVSGGGSDTVVSNVSYVLDGNAENISLVSFDPNLLGNIDTIGFDVTADPLAIL